MKQIQVIMENKTGALDEILHILSSANINVESLDVESIGQQGVVSLMVNAYEEGFKLLTHAGYQVVSEDVLLLSVQDQPGALGVLSRRLHEANIGIRSVRIIHRGDGYTTVGLVADDNTAARELLSDAIFGQEQKEAVAG